MAYTDDFTLGKWLANLLFFIIVWFLTRSFWNRLYDYHIQRRKGCQPPNSFLQKDPFFGLDLIYSRMTETYEKRTRDTVAQDRFTKYGHTFQSKLYGGTEIVTESPEVIKAVYGTDFESFGVGPMRSFSLGPLTGNGLMTTDGPAWKTYRSTLTPIFAAALNHQNTFAEHVERLLHLIPRNGSTIDLQPIFNRLSLDTSTELLFGESLFTLKPNPPADALKFLNSFNYALRGVGRRNGLPFWDFLTRDPKFWLSCQETHQFVEKKIDKILQTSPDIAEDRKYSLVYELVKLGQSRLEIRNQLLNLYLPTHAAISTPLTNIFFALARNPRAWNRLHQEIKTFGSETLSAKNLKTLTYLGCVINETLRLYNAISANERVALSDTILPFGGGPDGTSPIFVKKNTRIILWFSTLARRKDLWGCDADQWRPERWLNAKPDRWINLAYGAGPRMCPASELGWIQIAITVVRIMQTFSGIENRDPVAEFVDQWKVTTVSKNGAKVGFIV